MNIAILLLVLTVIWLILVVSGASFVFLIASFILFTVLTLRNISIFKKIHRLSENANKVFSAGKGSIFVIKNFEENNTTSKKQIDAKNLYMVGDEAMYEFLCRDVESKEKNKFLAMEENGDVDLYLEKENLKMEDLNITAADLDAIDDKEYGSVNYNKVKYKYSDSDFAKFYRFCESSSRKNIYYWMFEHKNYLIMIEKLENNSYEVSYYQRVPESKYRVQQIEKAVN